METPIANYATTRSLFRVFTYSARQNDGEEDMAIRTNVKTVGVIGTGTMGAGIAQTFAQSGRTVLMYDAVPGAVERALHGDRRLETPFD